MSEKKSTNGRLAPLIPQDAVPPIKARSRPVQLRQPVEVALFNLSGLGLGYLYIRAWVRWIIYLLISIGLVITAFIKDAHRLPILWGLIFILLPLWMSYDGWMLARRLIRQSPDQTVAWKRAALITAGGILAGVIVGLVGYVILGQVEFKKGMTAYESNDYPDAKQHFTRVTSLYELTLNPVITMADLKIEECDILIPGEYAMGKGEFQKAIGIYETYLKQYGNESPDAYSYISERTAQAYSEWALQLRSGGKYNEAIEKYQVILSKHNATPTGMKIATPLAETYVEWGTNLQADGLYQDAIETFQHLKDYPDTSSAGQMDTLVADAYLEWAVALRADHKFETAIGNYQKVINQYGQTQAGAKANTEIVASYAEWATYLRSNNQYETAIQKYLTLSDRYPQTLEGGSAKKEIANTYIDWGSYLIRTRDYFGAMDKYDLAKKVVEDKQIADEADQGHKDALNGLSQDSTVQGQQVLAETLEEACDGKVATSPVIGLNINEPGRALFCSSESPVPMTLSPDLTAIRPEHFLYVLKFSSGVDNIQSCPYTGGYRLVRTRSWWKVDVYGTLTGKLIKTNKFYGSSPDSCPYTYSFWVGNYTSYMNGGSPSQSDVMLWLKKIFK